jgi:hypothetical protein
VRQQLRLSNKNSESMRPAKIVDANQIQVFGTK